MGTYYIHMLTEHFPTQEEEFPAGETFPEGQLIKMGKKAMSVLAVKDEDFYEGMGVYFVTLAINLGYTAILMRLGRYLRDMMMNLDNLHDYLRATFPRIKPPSFFIEEESEKRKYH